MSLAWVLLATVIAATALVLGGTFQLHRLRRSVAATWCPLEAHLLDRYDLIAELASHVQDPLSDQPAILEALLHARNQAVQFLQVFRNVGGPTATGMAPLLEAEARLISSLQQLLAEIDRRIEHFGIEAISTLRDQLAEAESKVFQARSDYNDAAIWYNLSQKRFPGPWIAERGRHFPVDLYRINQLGD